MDKRQAVEDFIDIEQFFDAIDPPKYRNIDLDTLTERYERLLTLKAHLRGDAEYLKLINAMSQVIAKLEKHRQLQEAGAGCWSNLSERGMNIAIPPVYRRKGVEFPVEWTDKWGNTCSVSNGYWGNKNYRVMDALGYMLLLKMGGDRLPEDIRPIFEDLGDIEVREKQLNGHLSDDTTLLTPYHSFHREPYSIGFSDRDFRKNTDLDLSSKQIHDLLLETSRVEFKLSYPIRLKSTGRKMNLHRMNFYSRFFELGSGNNRIRKDGIVQERIYRITFNTLLGELFVNNLLAAFNDRIGLDFYTLPDSAQIFYRRKLLTHSYPQIDYKLSTIAKAAGLRDSNRTNLIRTIERNILEPLKDHGYILSWEPRSGNGEPVYRIKREVKANSTKKKKDAGSVKKG
jgi:hypothetical protein